MNIGLFHITASSTATDAMDAETQEEMITQLDLASADLYEGIGEVINNIVDSCLAMVDVHCYLTERDG